MTTDECFFFVSESHEKKNREKYETLFLTSLIRHELLRTERFEYFLFMIFCFEIWTSKPFFTSSLTCAL